MCGITSPGSQHTSISDKHQALSSLFPALSQSVVCNPAYLEASFRCSNHGASVLGSTSQYSSNSYNSESKCGTVPRFESGHKGVGVEKCCSGSSSVDSSLRDHSIDTLLYATTSQATNSSKNKSCNKSNSKHTSCFSGTISTSSISSNSSNKRNNVNSNNNSINRNNSNNNNNNNDSSINHNHSIRSIVGPEGDKPSKNDINDNSDKTPSPDSSSPWSSPHISNQEREHGTNDSIFPSIPVQL